MVSHCTQSICKSMINVFDVHPTQHLHLLPTKHRLIPEKDQREAFVRLTSSDYGMPGVLWQARALSLPPLAVSDSVTDCHAVYCASAICPLLVALGTTSDRQLALMKAVLCCDLPQTQRAKAPADCIPTHWQNTSNPLSRTGCLALATWVSVYCSKWLETRMAFAVIFGQVCVQVGTRADCFIPLFCMRCLAWFTLMMTCTRTDLVLQLSQQHSLLYFADRLWIWTFTHCYKRRDTF